jgi:hypothetical protein
MRLRTRIGTIAGALALLVAIAFVTPSVAQQPTTVNPTASSVKED